MTGAADGCFHGNATFGVNETPKVIEKREADEAAPSSAPPLLVPGFTEEPVLDQEGGAEHDGALDRHGAEVLPHHVPAEGVLESVFT